MTLSTFFCVLFALYSAIVLLWLVGLTVVRRLTLTKPAALGDSATPTDQSARLAVFVTAHNEERRIAACINRLLEQNYPGMTITVINDRSRDRTAECVREIMAKDSRVRLVEIETLPPGWIGKTHALAFATRSVDADYMLFVDGDCRLSPGVVKQLMDKVLRERIDFLTLWPRLELASPSERLLTPPAIWLLGAWTGIESIGRKPGESVPMGNGQFLLMSLTGYRKIGGHESVQAELAEDAIMANRAAAAGLNCCTLPGEGVYLTTRDNKPSTTINALTRVLIGSLVQPWRMLVSQHLLLGGCAMPLWVIPVAGYFAVTRGLPGAWACLAAGALHWLLMVMALRPLFDIVFATRGSLWHFPIGAAVCVGVTVRAFFVMLGVGRVRWGTSYYKVRGSQIVGAAT